MELTKTDVIDKIPELYRPYVIAMRSPQLGASSRHDNINAIILSLTKALLFKKVVNDDKSDRLMAETLYIELSIKMPYITHNQIELAFRNGVIGEYGEYFGINPATMFQWCKAYIYSKENIDARIELNKVMDEIEGIAKAKKPKGDLAMSDEQILSYYNDWLNDKLLMGKLTHIYSRICYDEICKRKGVKTLLNESKRKEIEGKILIEYERELRAKKTKKETMVDLLLSMDKDNATFASIGKKLALEEYFKECKLNGVKPI